MNNDHLRRVHSMDSAADVIGSRPMDHVVALALVFVRQRQMN